MTTTLVLIRHAPTAENDTHVMIGRTNPTLHDAGRAKALRLANTMIGIHFHVVISSPLHRAVETAKAIAISRPWIDFQVDDGLRELDLGAVDGMSSYTAYDAHRDAFDLALSPDTEDFSFPNGELWSVAANRMKQTIDSIVQAHRDKTVCIVSHGGVLGLWRCRLENIQRLGNFRNMQPKHASFSVVMNDDQTTWIQRWSDGAHLEGE